MNRPRSQWVRSILIMSGSALVTYVLLGVPADAASPTGKISAGQTGLSVRTAATTLAGRTGTLRTGTSISIQCQVTGQSVGGRVRTTNLWNRIITGAYVSDAYVTHSGAIAKCPTTPATAPATPAAPATSSTNLPPITGGTPAGKWYVPVSVKVTQGYRTAARPTHDGEDMMAVRYTEIHATAAGTVVTVTCNASTKNCDVDGSPSVTGCGWYVEVRHSNNIVTRYCHMVRRPAVTVGQVVSVNQVIGYVGTSGNSSGPHLHFEVHTGYPATRANAVDPIDFMRRAGAKIN